MQSLHRQEFKNKDKKMTSNFFFKIWFKVLRLSFMNTVFISLPPFFCPAYSTYVQLPDTAVQNHGLYFWIIIVI